MRIVDFADTRVFFYAGEVELTDCLPEGTSSLLVQVYHDNLTYQSFQVHVDSGLYRFTPAGMSFEPKPYGEWFRLET